MQKKSERYLSDGLVMMLSCASLLVSMVLVPLGAPAQELKKKEISPRRTETTTSGNIIDVPRVSGGEYTIAPGSKGNQLVLSFKSPLEKAKGSGAATMDSIMVWVVRPPQQQLWDLPAPKVRFTPEYQVVSYPEEGDIDASFTFDVDRDVKRNGKDTIEFVVVGRGGPMMRKTLTFSYSLPEDFQLDQNFPNPFNPSTTIYYQLPADSRIMLKIYDILGREVKTLVDEQRSAGYYNVLWDGTNDSRNKVSSGVYIYRIEAKGVEGNSGFSNLKKMILLK